MATDEFSHRLTIGPDGSRWVYNDGYDPIFVDWRGEITGADESMFCVWPGQTLRLSGPDRWGQRYAMIKDETGTEETQ